jgi:iron(III) transport system permease protein
VARTGLAIPRQPRWLEWAGTRAVGIFEANLLPFVCGWLVLGAVALLALFILYSTFLPGLPTEGGLTLNNWAGLASPYVVTRVLPNTLIVGVGTVLVSLAFASPLAWLLNRTNLPLRNLCITLIAVVVIVPGFVKAMGWLLLINERIGLINKTLAGLLNVETVPLGLNNPFGMAWVMGLALTPSVFFLISGPMRTLDPALEEAASASGASWWRTFVRISLPLLGPAILGGAIYNFMTAISMFDVPAMLGAAGGQSPVLAAELFYAVHPANQSASVRYGAAGVYGVVIAAPSLVALYFYHRLLAQAHRFAVITGKGYRPRDVDLGRARYPALAFVLLYLLLAVVFPLLVLVWVSLLPVLQLPSAEALAKVSLNNYQLGNLVAALGGPTVLPNTLALIAIVPVLVLFFSFMISWVVVRTRLPLRRTMDTMAMLPHAIPGLGFAFALFMVGILLARAAPWLAFNGTVAIIVVANLLVLLAYGTRITNAALLQVQPELEESAHVCGARNTTTMWRIVVPLVKPSLVFAALWTALLAFREVSMALFLAGPKNWVLSVGVWMLWQQGRLNLAAAAAILMVLVMGALLLLTLWLAGGRLTAQHQADPVQPRT